MNEYKIVNGTYYDKDTPDKVIQILERFRGTNQRIRVFYGDTKTGRNYGDEFDTMGYVRRSMGPIKVPILVHNSRSIGGGHMLDSSIVRITVDKRNVYIHPKYYCKVTVKGNEVYLNGKIHARAKTHEKAMKLAAFFRGDSNIKG